MATAIPIPERIAPPDLESHRPPPLHEGLLFEASQEPSPPPAPYLGRPAIPGLTAITPRIRATKLEGHAPASVLFSASESSVVAGPGADAFMDLHWRWSIDDVVVKDGSPMVLHTFEGTGSFTVTLEGFGKDEGGNWISASTSTLRATSKSLIRAHSATTGSFALRAVVGKPQPASATFRATPAKLLQLPAPHGIVRGSGGLSFATWARVRPGAPVSDQTIAGLYSVGVAGNRPLRIQYMGASTGGFRATANAASSAVTATGGYGDGSKHWLYAEIHTGDNKVRVGVDGSALAEVGASLNTDSPTTVPFVLGGTYNPTAATRTQYGFDGSLQHFGVWNRPLTVPERAALYNGGLGVDLEDAIAAVPSLANGLLAWWPLDEPYGVRRDASGNGNDLIDSPIAGATTIASGAMAGAAMVYPSGGETTAPILYDDGLGHFSGTGGEGAGGAPVEFPEEEWVRRTKRAVVAIEALPAVGPGNVRQLGREFVEFGGSLAGTPVAVCPGAGSGGFDGSTVVAPEGLPAGSATSILIEDWPTRYATAYFDSTFTGTPTGSIGSPFNTPATLKTWIERHGGGVRIRIKRGSTFTLASTVVLGGGAVAAPILIEAYGTGPNPVISGPTKLVQYYGNFAAGLAGFAASGVDFVTTGGNAFFCPITDLIGAEVPPARDGFHLIGCRVQSANGDDNLIQFESNQGGNFTFDACQFVRGAPTPGQTVLKPSGLDPEALRDLATKDCTWEGGGGNQPGSDEFAHHAYIHCWAHQLHANPTFLATSPDGLGGVYPQNLCIKFSGIDGATMPFLVLDGGDYGAGTNRIAVARQATQRPLASVFDEVVIQGIDFHEEDHSGLGFGIYAIGVLGITVRDCDFWGIQRSCVQVSCEGGGSDPNPLIGTAANDRVDLRAYRDRAALPDHSLAGNDQVCFLFADHFTALEVLDNQVVGLGPSPTMVKLPAGKTATPKVFRNLIYHAPAGTIRFLDTATGGGGTYEGLAAWQARAFAPDPPESLAMADPRWTEPSNGNFETRPADPLVATSTIRVAGRTTVEVIGGHSGGIEPYSMVVERAPDSPSEPYSFVAIGTATSGGSFLDATVVPGRSYHVSDFGPRRVRSDRVRPSDEGPDCAGAARQNDLLGALLPESEPWRHEPPRSSRRLPEAMAGRLESLSRPLGDRPPSVPFSPRGKTAAPPARSRRAGERPDPSETRPGRPAAR